MRFSEELSDYKRERWRAMLKLNIYWQGKGVARNYVDAYAWYRAGEAGGDERAASRLKALTKSMTREVRLIFAGIGKTI